MDCRASLRPVLRRLIQRSNGTVTAPRSPALTRIGAYVQTQRHMSSPMALPTSTVRRVQSVISGENSTWSFRCDEEPHMLGAERGPLGYYPLQLGHVFQHDRSDAKYEIVRKLGWGQNSSVWLAKVVRCDSREFSNIQLSKSISLTSLVPQRGTLCGDQDPHSQRVFWGQIRSLPRVWRLHAHQEVPTCERRQSSRLAALPHSRVHDGTEKRSWGARLQHLGAMRINGGRVAAHATGRSSSPARREEYRQADATGS